MMETTEKTCTESHGVCSHTDWFWATCAPAKEMDFMSEICIRDYFSRTVQVRCES